MTFRLLIDPPLDGAANMARDESLLEAVGRGDSPPTLRFYQWSPATISLGYFQDYAEYAKLPPPAGQLAVVRRQTGGGAILHDLELTYSLTVPIDHAFIAGNASRLYERVHAAAAALLREIGVPVVGPASSRSDSAHAGCSQRGPFFCFERHGPIDLLAHGRKIMGSAQRRTTSAVLQHGSLILDSRYPQQHCAAVAEFTSTNLLTLLPDFAARITGQPLTPAAWAPPELTRGEALRAKYAGHEWTRRQ